MLVGGFPCQAFSNAGLRRGFDDTRGTLFFEIARILNDKRPKYFLLENVKGLLYHNKGETFKTIIRILADLGYNVEWKIYNTKFYGLPQNRERVYIKGYSRNRCGGEIFHFGEEDEEFVSEETSIRKVGNFSNTNHQGCNVYDSNGLSPTLCSESLIKNGLHIKEDIEWDDEKLKIRKVTDDISITTTTGDCFCLNTHHRGRPLYKKQDTYIKIKNATKKGYLECEEEEDGICIRRDACDTKKGRVQKKSVGTLDTGASWGVFSNSRIRKLTPLECERLQGFPDNWTKFGVDGELISDSQRYKCIGNAVSINVVKYIMDNWELNYV